MVAGPKRKVNEGSLAHFSFSHIQHIQALGTSFFHLDSSFFVFCFVFEISDVISDFSKVEQTDGKFSFYNSR